VEPHIEPEPTPEERAAIEQALAAAAAKPTEQRSAWWQAGVEEALSGEPGRAACDAPPQRGRP
jgi:hypothetical protein